MYSTVVGFTLKAKLVSSKHLIQVHLETLSRSVENMASHFWQSILLEIKKLSISISPFIRILEPLHVQRARRENGFHICFWLGCSQV